MTTARLMTATAVAAVALASCGGGDGVRTVTVEAPAQETPTVAPVSGDAILIETRVTDGRRHIGEVLPTSVIGESAFCRGGTTTGGSDGPTITTKFHCRGGTLEVRFAPTQRSRVQSSAWEIVRGTADLKDLRGGGTMVAAFGGDDPDLGREIFTGTVSG